MAACQRCGHENEAGSRFCSNCTAGLAVDVPERRKLATLLFCDVSGSTTLGEQLDGETVRDLMFRYFHEMRVAVEGHGGTVEKFVGDAVMAVFGVPEAHEDDAARAVRAAVEMRERLAALNDEFDKRYGVTLALRIGLNTGEVVAGDAGPRELLVTGDAVNVAARLEQVAAPNDIVLGELTYQLTRHAVEAEKLPALPLKGKADPVDAYRFLSAEPAAVGRGATARFSGRAKELATLGSLFEQATERQHCVLATIVGDAGIGKSRLAEEFISIISGSARVLKGNCLSYGEGITYWPLAQIVRTLARIRDEDSPDEAREKLLALPARIAEPVAVAIGLGGRLEGPDQIPTAFRELFESLASERPLVLLVEDLHWAEAGLLALLRHVADQARGRILLLCTSRPDLYEVELEWPAAVRLEPLAEAEAERLVERQGGSSRR
jgi:class 3 adenylate cyclase